MKIFITQMDLLVTEFFESSEEELIPRAFLAHARSLTYVDRYICSTEKKDGSGRKRNIDQKHLEGARLLYFDYFADPPLYNENTFRRRFQMRRPLFLKIVAVLENSNPHFVQKRDATQRLGLPAIKKATAAIRQLAYGTYADACDEYLRIAESTALQCLKEFCSTIVQVFEGEYLRYPTLNDTQRLLQVAEARGFPGMLGSLDCMHWPWKNCPTAWAGQYQGKEKEPTIILKAVASYDLWIWHAFFWDAGNA